MFLILSAKIGQLSVDENKLGKVLNTNELNQQLSGS